MPGTAVRCLSQQFQKFTDEGNVWGCIGFSPFKVGNHFRQFVFDPILLLLPGQLGTYLGPEIDRALVARWTQLWPVMSKLTLGPIHVGYIVSKTVEFWEDWTGFDLKALFTLEPGKIIMQNMGQTDFAIDKRINRMKRVYDPTGRADCDRENMKKYGTDCPTAIPVREAVVSGVRTGDASTDPMQAYCSVPLFSLLCLCFLSVANCVSIVGILAYKEKDGGPRTLAACSLHKTWPLC